MKFANVVKSVNIVDVDFCAKIAVDVDFDDVNDVDNVNNVDDNAFISIRKRFTQELK